MKHAMAPTLNIVALDVGGRRIGVARGNTGAHIASPLVTLDREEGDIFFRLKELLQSENAAKVIVGLPRGMDGQETGQTVIAREFAAEVEKKLGIPVEMQDEAATSIKATEELERSKKPYTKGDIDKLAATYILQDWLDGQRSLHT